MKYALGLVAALALSATIVSPAQAEPDFAEVAVTPVSGWHVVPQTGTWWVRGGMHAKFAVDVTNRLHDEDDISVDINGAPEVVGYEGDGWECWDTSSTSVHCENNWFYAVADEPWPTLTIEVKVGVSHGGGRVDVQAQADEHEPVHDGFGYFVDTST